MRGNWGQAVESLLWFGALLALLGLSIGVVAVIRSRLKGKRAEGMDGFTLDQLRALRDQEKLSAEEFEALRNRVVTAFREGGAKRP